MKLTEFRYQPAFYCLSYFQIYNQNIDLMVAMETHNKAKKERKKHFTFYGFHKHKHNSSEDAHNTTILTKSTSTSKAKKLLFFLLFTPENTKLVSIRISIKICRHLVLLCRGGMQIRQFSILCMLMLVLMSS